MEAAAAALGQQFPGEKMVGDCNSVWCTLFCVLYYYLRQVIAVNGGDSD